MHTLAHDGASTTAALANRTGLAPERLEDAVASLLSDGSVVRRNGRLVIAEN
jgi:hypothetical protein